MSHSSVAPCVFVSRVQEALNTLKTRIIILLVLVFSWDFLTIWIIKKYHQNYCSSCDLVFFFVIFLSHKGLRLFPSHRLISFLLFSCASFKVICFRGRKCNKLKNWIGFELKKKKKQTFFVVYCLPPFFQCNTLILQ